MPIKKNSEDYINKNDLWKYINKKINHSIHSSHVLGVINILFEELLKDFEQDKEIKIFNFGKFVVTKTKPRKYHNIKLNDTFLAPGYKLLKFILNKRLKKKFQSLLDLDKIAENREYIDHYKR